MNPDQKTLPEITREDFPILSNKAIGNKQLVYLDHAATSQKPIQVIDALKDYYVNYNANVHRGAHQLSAQATQAFENARTITANFLNAKSSKEIVFTRNATEAINLVAHSWGEYELKQGDEIIITLMEHHSNIVPWQLLAKRKGCTIKYVGINDKGILDIDDLRKKLTKKTKLISFVHISNTLGCCNPVKEIVELAHKVGAFVLLDACQSLAHHKIDVLDNSVDFLVGSSHKLCGPTGIGFLWSREEILESIPPFLGGGEMIQEVFLDHSEWADLPHKFEAGTPAIGEAIAMGTAIEYLQSIGLEKIHSWEKNLISYLFQELQKVPNINILGPTPNYQTDRGVLATFSIEGIHSDDISTLLNNSGICIRSGHHCCQPLHKHYGLISTARASMSFTTTMQEIDYFVEELITTLLFLRENS